MKLSVCLATFNEEKNIQACLKSVKSLADEIVVVDGTSTDQTTALAKKLGAKVVVRENPLMFHINKQEAFEAATGDWILYLDADERVGKRLKKEIRTAIKKGAYDGFWIPRKNIIFGKWIKHTGWWPDHQLRLFRRGKASLPCQSVHEQPELTGKAAYLKSPLVHHNYQTVSQFIRKLNDLYTENDKDVFLREKKKISWQDAFRLPVAEFFRRFFKQEGYKDGLHGLVLSFLQAFSAFVTFAKIWEARGFKEEELPLHDFPSEIKKFGKEISYWIMTALLKETRGPIRKFLLKLKRKLKTSIS